MPLAQYTRAWFLCAVDPAPAKDPVVTARLTRYCVAGRGDAVADTMWPDLDGPTGGAVRVYGSVSGNDFVVYPMGILNRVRLEARRDMAFDVYETLTGNQRSHHELVAGQSIDLDGGEAFLVKGQYR